MNTEGFIGLPFRDGGRDRAGVDCWGLVKLFYQERLGVTLPEFEASCFDTQRIGNLVEAARVEWHRLPCPVAPCVVAIRLDPDHRSVVNHAGVYLGEGNFLHAIQRMGSVIQRVDHPYYRNIIEGFYAWPS